jgi:hypothetical protein
MTCQLLFLHFAVLQDKDEAFSWELIGQLSGIDPRELVGERARNARNGLLGGSDERSLFNMLAWYLEPEVSRHFRPFSTQSSEDTHLF